MPPKRTSTSEAPAMTQAAIRKLVTDSVTAALEAQAATMANADNTNRNTGEREAPIARKLFSRSNCTKDCKVKFATEQKIGNLQGYAATPTENNGNTSGKPPFVRNARTASLKDLALSNEILATRWANLNQRNCRNKGPATRSNLLPKTVTCHVYEEKGHCANQCRKTTTNNA
ncbi:hypothetical protein Tco_0844355 [Tanacetum coccineum]